MHIYTHVCEYTDRLIVYHSNSIPVASRSATPEVFEAFVKDRGDSPRLLDMPP